MKRLSAIERFESNYIPVTESGCWIWVGETSHKGYGMMNINNRKVSAHKFSYEWHYGPRPEGLVHDHLCRVRCCVNPTHLRVITNKENVLIGESFAAVNAKKTHCLRGHEYNEVNTVQRAHGWRECRICRRDNERKRNGRI